MSSFHELGKTLKNELDSNDALYIALAVFTYIYCMQGSVPVRHYDSVFIFKVELLFVLFCLVVNRGLSFKRNSNWLNLGLFLWILYCLSSLLLCFHKDSQFDLGYLYKAFHSVFIYFSVLVFNQAAEAHKRGLNAHKNMHKHLIKIVFLVLCLSTFLVAITSGSSAGQNSNMVLKYELLFVLTTIFFLKRIPDLRYYYKAHKLVVLMFLFWVLSVTISFLISPYDINTKTFVYERFDQTIMHGVFFLFAFDFFRWARVHKNLVPLMLPASVVAITCVFIVSWFHSTNGAGTDWFLNPPLNGHIRYVGYIATASACAVLPFVLYPGKFTFRSTTQLMLLLVSTSLLCWTGGRAAVGSLIIVFVAMSLYLGMTKNLQKPHFLFTASTLVLAFILAEHLSVFDWNGFSRLWVNNASAVGTSSLNEVTTGRVGFWDASIESLKGHLVFGLGPQGYYFMPSRVWGLHPHNMFIQFLVEWGIIGAILFTGLMAIAAIKIVGFLRKSTMLPSVVFLSSVAIVTGLTIHGLVDGTYYHGQPSFYIALALALCMSEITIQKNERK